MPPSNKLAKYAGIKACRAILSEPEVRVDKNRPLLLLLPLLAAAVAAAPAVCDSFSEIDEDGRVRPSLSPLLPAAAASAAASAFSEVASR